MSGPFAPSYAQARALFLDAARSAGMALEHHTHPLPGREGEALALDVALDGDPQAERLFIVSSACHGVEGHCGSGVQVMAARHSAWREHARQRGVAVLYLHTLNPWGFSHRQRTTHENADLNRNFQDFAAPLPANPAYAELHPLLLPAQWPPQAENEAAIAGYIATHGLPRYQAAVSQGQHSHPDGLFFGGHAPTWSHQTLRAVLGHHARAARHIAWMDLHTGLGPSGVGERIYAGREDAQAIERARAWWAGGGATPVTSIYDGTSTSARLTGLMWNAIYDAAPQANYTGIAMEYGTVPITEVIDALRGAHWLRLHPEATAEQRAAIEARTLAAFYVDTDRWRQQVLDQALQALMQGADGLASLR